MCKESRRLVRFTPWPLEGWSDLPPGHPYGSNYNKIADVVSLALTSFIAFRGFECIGR